MIGWKRSMIAVGREELVDSWIRGPGLWLLLGIAGALSAVTIGLAYTAQINLLDAREGLAILVRISLGLGVLLAAFSAADSISGERDRSTLEALLLTPTPHRSLALGKFGTALVWWMAAFLVSVPYLWAMGTGLGGSAALAVAGIGGLFTAMIAVGGAGIGSLYARSNLHAFGIVVMAGAVLAVPGLLPAAMMRGAIGTALLRADPISAVLHLVNVVVVDQQPLVDVASWLISPVVSAVAVAGLAAWSARRIALEPGI